MDRNQLLNDPETAQRYALSGLQARMWTAMPAIVIAVDLVKMTLQAQPAIKGVQTSSDGTTKYVNLPPLVDVPICFPSAGGFTLTFPIKAGDEVLVIIASRCIDAWWQNGGLGIPMELRMHDLSDGFAIPGPKSLPNAIPAVSALNAQLRTDVGTTYIEITPAGLINLVSPTGIGILGNVVLTGTLTAVGEITANGIPLSTHLHSGVTPGIGTSGPPIP